MQNYPGWQIDAKAASPTATGAKNATASGSDPLKTVNMRLRMFIAGRYLYIVGATGSAAWLGSPCVSDFMGSVEIRPELTSIEKARQLQQQTSTRSEEEAEARKRAFDQRFQESQSNARKAFEKAQADFQYRRNH